MKRQMKWGSASAVTAAVTAVLMGALAATPGQAQEVEQIANGIRYIVNEDNTKVLRTEPIQADATSPVCTPESPCLYDHLPMYSEFVASGGKWPGGALTYGFVNDSPDIALARERAIIAQAFGLWSNVAKVFPRELAAGADPCVPNLRILWGAGNHGDPFPFDGVGGVLAHAFFPPPVNPGCIAGDTHFDEAETWVSPSGGGAGIDLATVAAHEFGHALGLNHSADPNALMAPFYTGRRAFLSLDDIRGIISIYGSRTQDVILQIEETNTIAPGLGSFRLGVNSVVVGLRNKGAGTFNNTTLPAVNAVDRADVDGVLSRGAFGARWDGFWFNQGDLYRTILTMPAAATDIDQVRVQMAITNNGLSAPATLAVSLNGLLAGVITVNPGDANKVVTFPVHFVNPVSAVRDVGSNLYNDSRH
jgi:hypothetical protein